MDNFERELREIKRRAWITAVARYNAARRLRVRQKLSTVTIAFLSAVGIATPILSVSGFTDTSGASLALYSSLLALLVLVVGLIEGLAGHEVSAAELHRNAEDLNAFQAKLGVVLCGDAALAQADVVGFAEEFSRIKLSCSRNHETVDFNLACAQHRSSPEFLRSDGSPQMNGPNALFHRAHYWLYSKWWMFIVWAVSMGGLIYFINSVPNPMPAGP